MKPTAVSRAYYKPLLPGDSFHNLTPELVLKKLQKELAKKMRMSIMQTTFSDRAKKALSQSLKFEIKPSSLVMSTTHPSFVMFLQGRKKRQMTWLLKARAPIPIILDNGELIFRTATPRSMARGGWVHPGRDGVDFLSRPKREAREWVKKEIMTYLKKQIRESFKKNR